MELFSMQCICKPLLKKASIRACVTEMMQSFVFRLEMVRLQGHINSALNVLTRCHKTWSELLVTIFCCLFALSFETGRTRICWFFFFLAK